MKPNIENQLTWIEQGYSIFASEGPFGLKVERIAKLVGKNKSSFYHYFADMEIFTSRLLKLHINQAKIIAEKESKTQSQEELIEILVTHKIDLLFNRQLRIHRENPSFETCFCQVNEITIPAIMGVWAELIGLQENTYLAKLVLNLSLENFYLQITEETLNQQWLHDYFEKLKQLVRAFKQSNIAPTMDGSV
ncbi:MAG: TetR/AcrR family transcriptional regulator [Cyclobacteriaceae bacterium]